MRLPTYDLNPFSEWSLPQKRSAYLDSQCVNNAPFQKKGFVDKICDGNVFFTKFRPISGAI